MAKKGSKPAESGDAETIVKGRIQWRIYPDKKSGNWMLYARVAGERILRCRSTKQGAKDAIAGELERLANRGIKEEVMLSGPAAGAYQAAMKALSIFDDIDLEDVARFYIEHHKHIKVKIDTQKAVDAYRKEKKSAGLSYDYLRCMKTRLGHFCEEFGSYDVTSITNQKLTDWLSKYTGKTRNNHRGEVSCFLNWCQAKGYIKEGSTAATNIQKAKENGESLYIATQAQFDLLLSIAKGIKPPITRRNATIFVAFSFLSGIRSSEISRLRWSNIFKEHITIGREDAKTASRRLVPLNPRLSQILEECKKDHDIKQDEKLTTRVHFQEALTDAIKSKRKTHPQDCEILPDVWPKNFGRHSWISYCVAMNNDVAKTALQAGNSPAKIFSNYRSITLSDGTLITEDLSKAWFGY